MSLRDLARRSIAEKKCDDPGARCQHSSCLKRDGPWWFCNHGEEWLPGNLVSMLADIKFGTK